MNRKVLVVVDMQDGFLSSASQVVLPVLCHIRDALALGIPIVIVQYEEYGSTLDQILDILPNNSYVRVWKSDDDGADEVLRAMKVFSLPAHTDIFLCGVNGGYCVCDTFHSLRAYGYDTYLLEDAIACNEEDWRKFYNPKDLWRFVSSLSY